jgi:hypothetical protein
MHRWQKKKNNKNRESAADVIDQLPKDGTDGMKCRRQEDAPGPENYRMPLSVLAEQNEAEDRTAKRRGDSRAPGTDAGCRVS